MEASMSYDPNDYEPSEGDQRIGEEEIGDSNWAVGGTIALVVFLYIFVSVANHVNNANTALSEGPLNISMSVITPPAASRF
jgi:hypothetical protein